jgi:peptidoglycan/LPS O-acetylase OafA/YrhL
MAATERTTPQSIVGVHLPVLDGFRGLAILAVIIMHAQVSTATTLTDRLVAFFADGGWFGVDLFFVLSGFLITGILIDTLHARGYLRNFYARRALRILPLYYVVLCVLLYVVDPGSMNDRLGWFVVNLGNWDMALSGTYHGDQYFNVLWSLGVEEQFYLVWPLVVVLVSRRGLLKVCIGLVVASFGWRLWMVLSGFGAPEQYMLTPTSMDAIAAGAAVAVLAREPGGLAPLAPVARWVGAAGALLLIGVAAVLDGFNLQASSMLTDGLGLGTITFGALLVSVLAEPPTSILVRVLGSRPLRQLGRYSYAMYLFHVTIVEALLKQGLHPDVLLRVGPGTLPGQIVFTAGTIALSYASALVSWHVLERPCLSLKRFFETPSPPLQPAYQAAEVGGAAAT